MNIDVLFMDLGKLKGFYKRDGHNRFIIINDQICEPLQRIVCAHELGHDQLHRHIAENHTLQEFAIYDMKSKPEYEANLFASEILLPDEKIFTLAREGYDVEQIAKELCTDVNLVAIKVASMNTRGYRFNTIDSPKCNFLK